MTVPSKFVLSKPTLLSGYTSTALYGVGFPLLNSNGFTLSINAPGNTVNRTLSVLDVFNDFSFKYTTFFNNSPFFLAPTNGTGSIFAQFERELYVLASQDGANNTALFSINDNLSDFTNLNLNIGLQNLVKVNQYYYAFAGSNTVTVVSRKSGIISNFTVVPSGDTISDIILIGQNIFCVTAIGLYFINSAGVITNLTSDTYYGFVSNGNNLVYFGTDSGGLYISMYTGIDGTLLFKRYVTIPAPYNVYYGFGDGEYIYIYTYDSNNSSLNKILWFSNLGYLLYEIESANFPGGSNIRSDGMFLYNNLQNIYLYRSGRIGPSYLRNNDPARTVKNMTLDGRLNWRM